MVKNPPAHAGDTALIPDLERFPHATRQPSQCPTTTEPAIYSLGAAAIRGLCAPQLESAPPSPQLEKSPPSNKDPAQPKISKSIVLKCHFFVNVFFSFLIQTWRSHPS